MHANTHSNGGAWHKDSYWGYTRRVRNHRPWWVMIMYYPQDVKTENGPTGVLPGRQCHMSRGPKDELGADAVTGEAGTCFMIHYDIWHRATPNTSGINRQMLKFEFMRLDAPEQPAWNCTDREWRDPEKLPLFNHRGLWRQSWNFLAGKRRPAQRDGALAPFDSRTVDALKSGDGRMRMDAADQLERCGPQAAAAIAQLTSVLDDDFEPAAINASYALAAIGAPAIGPLMQTVKGGSDRAALNATYALAAMGGEAVPELLNAVASNSAGVRAHACFALGEIRETGGDTIGALARAMKDADPIVRLHAVEALGMKGGAARNALPVLIDALKDSDVEVRFNAVLALTRLGAEASSAVSALAESLNDPDRYVRGYAVDALHQIGTRSAFDILIPYLKTARWCTSTTEKSLF
jgi:hypothetical protein